MSLSFVNLRDTIAMMVAMRAASAPKSMSCVAGRQLNAAKQKINMMLINQYQ